VFVWRDLGLSGRLDRSRRGRLRCAQRFDVVVLSVVVLLAGDRLFELADALAEAVAELRQPFRPEHHQGDDEDDDDLEGADISKHFSHGNGVGWRPDQEATSF
jgi:hypothetical protein